MDQPSRAPLTVRGASHQRKLLVAIDFGTTYSAISWGDSRMEKPQDTIREWPNGDTDQLKVPTVLQWDANGELLWGWEVQWSSRDQIHQMFKLGLDPDKQKETRLATRYPNVVKSPDSDIDARSLTALYLSSLRARFDEYLKTQPNYQDLQSSKRQYIITVPAVWSDMAKTITLNCAIDAGMGDKKDIRIESEPEAAAIRVLADLEHYKMKKGDTFLVCDAGGGTVDLISYTITDVYDSGTTKVPQVVEAMQGEGHVCGGLFINRLFAEYLKDKYPGITADEIREADQLFELYIKRPFAGHSDRPRWTVVPNRDRLKLTGRDVKGFFTPVVSEIEELVMNQISGVRKINKEVDYVILVGGLGANQYLQKRLRKRVGDHIKVYTPRGNGCHTAVVEGALIKGLVNPPQVEKRVARRNYGTICLEPYNHNLHRGLRQQPGDSTGRMDVWAMQWLVRQGDLLYSSDANKYAWERKVSRTGLEYIDMDICSYEDKAGQKLPIDPDAPGVMKPGKLRVPVSELPENAKRRKKLDQDGEECFFWDFEIRMTLESATLRFSLWVGNLKYSELPIHDETEGRI